MIHMEVAYRDDEGILGMANTFTSPLYQVVNIIKGAEVTGNGYINLYDENGIFLSSYKLITESEE